MKKQKTISCPHCGWKWTPGHMAWASFRCEKCKKFVDKKDWIKK